MGSYMNI